MKIPEGASVEVEKGGAVKLTVNGKSFERHYRPRMVNVRVEGGQVIVEPHGKPSREKNAMAGALSSHLKNLFSGERFQKKLKIVYAHFPISVEVKGSEVFIKNFLGEKTPRKTKVFGDGVKVEVKGPEIIVSGNDPEQVGQTASNIVRVTKVRALDNRVFQDGIYYEE
ncbi:50S ribosomal protein L6 [Candidatus Micrarchaeota archaeon CG_4_10_14_0_2_um_filter_55_9]|nr:MAG: 50S ribosomal protein L6 [Candidatus Micrarchaeota archaeon CG1_02_55_41]PIO02561.1 MAG: 50S ribosomal protein L6 [Candidatus Micrarchaeota archaeon CG09_land_8_20_14_0_10_55_25]PIZ91569.1 MAG: 50S ribosomal protein L6 [Candidatus Micrarchaeota archaeon CG_4_10_14_0_2_um_filter_55_9]PJD01014.1 MAG: 50S ribosomal protein L6 [Candidatus Micrarchaeota archaeon CG10_big_fil_rev_8_21_14_0_10_54_18]